MRHTRLSLEILADQVRYARGLSTAENAYGPPLLAALVPAIQAAIPQTQAVRGMTWAEWLIEREIALGHYTREGG